MLRLKNLGFFPPWRAEPLPCKMNASIHRQTHWQIGVMQNATESKAQEVHVFSKMKHTKKKLPLGGGVGHVPCSQNL